MSNTLPAPAHSHARTVVVLTGASSGIGHATALAYARCGARLVLAARGVEALETLAEACRLLDAEVLVVPTDVSKFDAVQALAKAAVQRFGQIDVWINNAGVGAVGEFACTPMAAHRQIIETNLLGHMHGAHAVLPHFRERGKGTLINVISVSGWAASAYAAAYTASKFGLRGFTQSLHAELSGLPAVHVCAVYPTFVDTPAMLHGANYTGKRLQPPPPLVDPRSVANVLLSLAHRPRASTSVGSVAMPSWLAGQLAPQLTGRISREAIRRALGQADTAPVTDGNLFAPSQGHNIDGGYRMPMARKVPVVGAALLGVAALGWLWAHAHQRHHMPAARQKKAGR